MRWTPAGIALGEEPDAAPSRKLAESASPTAILSETTLTKRVYRRRRRIKLKNRRRPPHQARFPTGRQESRLVRWASAGLGPGEAVLAGIALHGVPFSALRARSSNPATMDEVGQAALQLPHRMHSGPFTSVSGSSPMGQTVLQ